MTFIKADGEKTRFDLVEPEFVEGIAEIQTFGAKKYSDNNWKKCTTPRRTYLAAALRHIVAYWKGERLDPETGKSHLYHLGCCIMYLDWFDRNEIK